VLSRRLEDRIRELCAKVVAAKEEEEVGPAISELKSALREHNQRLGRLAVTKLTGILPALRKRSF
jgi:hypothetical protein